MNDREPVVTTNVDYIYQPEPLKPLDFSEFAQQKFMDIYDCITKRGLGALEAEVKGVLGDTLDWQKEVDEYDKQKQSELQKAKRKAKVKVKKQVKVVKKAKSKSKRK